MSRARTEVLADAAAVAEAAAERIAAVVAAGGHVALAGGSSPKRAYALLAERETDFSGATLWYSDDRAVGPDDERSNHRMAAGALLDRLPEPRRGRVHRIEGELGAEAAASRYEALIRAELGDSPAFDLILLGLGPDAHCASLFPGKPEVEIRDRLVAPVAEAGMEPYVPRVTFTLPLINAARSVVFMVAGADKAEAARRAFGSPADQSSPAARVRPAEVLIDAAAAAELAQ